MFKLRLWQIGIFSCLAISSKCIYKESARTQSKPIEPTTEFKQNNSDEFLYSLYNIKDGFSIPAAETDLINKSGGNATYGEITQEGVNLLIDKIKPTKDDVFYDLGSGQGKMTTHIYLKTPVKKSVGIELSKSRYEGSKKIFKDLMNQNLLDPKRKLEFYNKNIKDVPLKDATIIYLSSLCFPQKLIQDITNNILRDTKGKLYLITFSSLPKDSGFTLQEKVTIPMTWSKSSPLYIYTKNN